MFLRKLFYALTCTAVLFTACDDNEPGFPGGGDGGDTGKAVEAIVVNEGVFTQNTGSISVLYTDGTGDTDIFRQVNERPLGDVAQDVALINGAYFVLMNNSKLIQVIDAATFQSKATIFASEISPTRITPISETEAIVSGGYGGGFLRISTVEPYGEVTPENGRLPLEYIATQGARHYMVAANGKLAVTDGSSQLNIYNLDNLGEAPRVITGVKTFSEKTKLLLDKNNVVWTMQKKSDETGSAIWCIGVSLDTELPVDTIKIPVATDAATVKADDLLSYPSWNRADIAGNKLYFPVYVALKDGSLTEKEAAVYEVNPENGEYRLHCKTPGIGMMYGFGVSSTGDVYVGDCIDWTAQQGYVRVYHVDGTREERKVGIYPTEVFFPDKVTE